MANQRAPLRKGDPLARCYVPNGRTMPTIYTARLREKPQLVKVGRTSKWSARRPAYDRWNLADGDGLIEYRLFQIHEDHVRLPDVEAAVLAAIPFPIGYGREWFVGGFEEVTRAVDAALEALGLDYF